MKKLALAVLIGIFCLGTTSTFAQTKQETPQEKIIRLEVENRVLTERVTALTQEIVSLQSQLAAAKAQHPQAAAQPAGNRAPALKPYYANMDIQQKCEKYDTCAKWAANTYRIFLQHTILFKITAAREESYFDKPSALFGGSGYTVYKLYLSTNQSPLTSTYSRWGKGQNPVSWEEKMYPAIHIPESWKN